MLPGIARSASPAEYLSNRARICLACFLCFQHTTWLGAAHASPWLSPNICTFASALVSSSICHSAKLSIILISPVGTSDLKRARERHLAEMYIYLKDFLHFLNASTPSNPTEHQVIRALLASTCTCRAPGMCPSLMCCLP